MNYYEHHIGDYDSATAHLSMLEDGAYRRLISLYYRTEKPLPIGIPAVCRLVRAVTKQEREAIANVLAEFFEQRDDGWHSARCDEEIARYWAKRPAAEAKKESDRERQHRSRDRRKGLFEELRRHGVTAPWDASTGELQAALSRVSDGTSHAPVTRDRSNPVTRDNTATQEPVTSHQSPNTREHTPIEVERSARGAPATPAPPVDPPKTSKAGAVCFELRKAGITAVSPQHPVLLALLEAGAEPAEFIEAAEAARGKANPFQYLLGVVKGRREEAAKVVAGIHRGAMPSTETQYERRARERMAQFAPGVAARAPGAPTDFIDITATEITGNVPAIEGH